MKNTEMILRSALAIVAFAITMNVSAQKQGGGHGARMEKMEQRMKEFSTRLGLSSTQETQVRDIMKQSHMDMKQYREANKNAPADQKRQAMKDMRMKTDAKITALLDPKQQELYKQFKAEKKEQVSGKRQGHKPTEAAPDEQMDDEGIL